MQLQRPVKWQAERLEDFLSRGARPRPASATPSWRWTPTAACWRCACARWPTSAPTPPTTGVVIQLLIGPWVTTSIYDIPLIDLHLTAVLTQHRRHRRLPRRRPARGDLHHRAADGRRRARSCRLDPAELRRRNMIRPEQMPYKNPMGQVYDVGAVRDRSSTRVWRWPTGAASTARRAASQARGQLRGRGIATFLEWTGGNALTEQVDGGRHRRRFHRADLGARWRWARASPPATRSWRSTCSACRSRASACCRATPTAPTASAAPAAARCSPAARRCAWRPSARVDQGKAARRRGAGGAGGRHRIPRRPLQRRRHRPRHRPVRAGGAPAAAAAIVGRRTAPRPARRAGRTAATSARSRSTRPPARSQVVAYASVNDIGRIVSPTIVRARSRAARCRASARRCASAWSTTPTAASC